MIEEIVWGISGCFAGAAIILAFVLIGLHMRNFTSKVQQRLIIRMTVMVPVYALNAWFALYFRSIAIYLNTLRCCYEAFVIYSFFTYLMYDCQLPSVLIIKHMMPICCFSFKPDVIFLRRCKQGTLQYVFIQVIMTILALVLNFLHVFHDGDFRPDGGYLYIMIINNASVLVAMYYLVLFYQVAKEKLEPHKPLLKFFVVKAVVFFSFWQMVAVAAMVKFGFLSQVADWSVEDLSNGIQNFCICVEMFAAAIAFFYAFPYSVYKTDAPTSLSQSVKHAFAVHDVVRDTFSVFVPRDEQHKLPPQLRRKVYHSKDIIFSSEFSSQDARPLRALNENSPAQSAQRLPHNIPKVTLEPVLSVTNMNEMRPSSSAALVPPPPLIDIDVSSESGAGVGPVRKQPQRNTSVAARHLHPDISFESQQDQSRFAAFFNDSREFGRVSEDFSDLDRSNISRELFTQQHHAPNDTKWEIAEMSRDAHTHSTLSETPVVTSAGSSSTLFTALATVAIGNQLGSVSPTAGVAEKKKAKKPIPKAILAVDVQPAPKRIWLDEFTETVNDISIPISPVLPTEAENIVSPPEYNMKTGLVDHRVLIEDEKVDSNVFMKKKGKWKSHLKFEDEDEEV